MSELLKVSLNNISNEFKDYEIYKKNYDFLLTLPIVSKLVNDNEKLLKTNEELINLIVLLKSKKRKSKKINKLRKTKSLMFVGGEVETKTEPSCENLLTTTDNNSSVKHSSLTHLQPKICRRSSVEEKVVTDVAETLNSQTCRGVDKGDERVS